MRSCICAIYGVSRVNVPKKSEVPEIIELAGTVEAMRPIVPAKDFETSRRFYEELGFSPQVLRG
jgi:hypothetical protein